MKKIFVFGVGLLFFVAAFGLTSDAQYYPRYYSQNVRTNATCLCAKNNSVDKKKYYQSKGCCDFLRRPIRANSGRIGPYRYRLTRSMYLNKPLNFSHPTGRHDVFYYKQYRTAKNLTRQQKLAYQKYQNPILYPRTANTIQSAANVVHRGDYKIANSARKIRRYQVLKNPIYSTNSTQIYSRTPLKIASTNLSIFSSAIPIYQPEGYIFTVPNGFQLMSDGSYKNLDSSLSFRITKTPKKYKCVQPSFKFCAIDLGKNFKDGENLTYIQSINNNFQWAQTVAQNKEQFPVYVENFFANKFGSRNAYFTFNALDPSNGSVVRIEAVSKIKDAKKAAQIVRPVFESFQFQY